MNRLLADAQAQFPFSQAVRRDLHRHPELGFQEVRTAGIVAAELTRLGYEVTTGVGQTGVVATLEGRDANGPVVLARFDMDALAVQEETGLEFASRVPGLMHACGHDGHVAVGLTVARLLHDRREGFSGTVKLVFQPAEEGLGGAEAMVKAGVLENPHPDYALALHLWNQRPVGWAAIHGGPLMAGSEIFEVKISGRGGHAALPEETIDPVVAAVQVVSALQTIVARNVPPLQSAILSVTQIHAGNAFNVIPPYAVLRGTIRTYEPEVRERVNRRFREVIEGVAGGLGCQTEIDLRELTPAVINDERVAAVVRAAAGEVAPEIQVDREYRTTVSEDMSFFLQQVPGCYFMVGSANPEGENFGHHHPKFTIDERVLPYGAALMTGAILRLLQAGNGSP